MKTDALTGVLSLASQLRAQGLLTMFNGAREVGGSPLLVASSFVWNLSVVSAGHS